MKRNMQQWVADLIANEKKPPICILRRPTAAGAVTNGS